MNDITKARYFLKSKGSKLQHLESFGLMLATAEDRYRASRIQKASKKGADDSLTREELDSAIDYAVLKYLKRHNQLPTNLPKVLHPGTSVEEKRKMVEAWVNG